MIAKLLAKLFPVPSGDTSQRCKAWAGEPPRYRITAPVDSRKQWRRLVRRRIVVPFESAR